MSLDERKQRILRAVTVDYINTAEPVGSRIIAKKYDLGISPATIRNEMADLEDSGYLQQPHTSAGRIPSDKGYRFYVDVLMDPCLLTESQTVAIRENLRAHEREFELIMHHASRFLTLLTSYTSVVFGPLAQRREIRHLQLVGMDQLTVLIILVTSPGNVQNRVCRLASPRSVDELTAISARINDCLRGQFIGDISQALRQRIAAVVPDSALVREIDALLTQEANRDAEAVHVDGAVNMLSQPEFRDIDKARSFLSLFEGKNMLAELMGGVPDDTGITVKIGHENGQGELQECSLVTASYEYQGRPIGKIGVVGPTRMDYGRAVGVVRFVAECLTEVLARLGG